MGKRCQTCGDNGWEELLMTCAKCRIAHEHCYCSLNHTFEIPIYWICSNCSMKPVKKNAASDSMTAGRSFQTNNERRIKARNESSKPVPKWKPIPDTSRMKLIAPEEAIRLSSGTTRKDFPSRNMVPRPLSDGTTMRLKTRTVAGLKSEVLKSTTVSRKSNPSFLQFKTVDPPRQGASQIGSSVIKQTAKAPEVLEGIEPNVGVGANLRDPKEKFSLSLSHKLVQFRLYLPALHATWKGSFIDPSTTGRFYGDFQSQPASKIRKKAYKLSKVMPALLNVELLTVGSFLNDLFENKKPDLCDVELYFFPDEKSRDRLKGKHTQMMDIMSRNDAMIRSNIKGTHLLIFASRLLDDDSQLIIQKQKKTSDFLWGVFLRAKTSQPPPPLLLLPPGTSYSNNASTKSPKKNRELNAPPGSITRESHVTPCLYWTPPPNKWVKLNAQRTCKPESDVTGCAGIVRDETGRWVCGYILNLKNLPELSADLWGVYQGLRLVWDRGFRKVIVETTSSNAMEALEGHSKNNSILQRCKDMMAKKWECRVSCISAEQNLCAMWLANKVEEQPAGLVVFDDPPPSLITLLEKDRTVLASSALV